MWFELYKDSCQQTERRWRWRLFSDDNDVIAISVQGYIDEDNCRADLIKLKKISHKTPIQTRDTFISNNFL